MQEQPVDIGLECPEDYVHQGQGTAGRNDSSAGSVQMSAILGGTTNRDVPRNIP
jgi:hypothetical protein